MKRTLTSLLAVAALAALPGWPGPARAQNPLNPLWVPVAQRGRIDAERSGFHDAARVRTVFWNYGMVGDYPADPLGVDLSVFHSAEAPKGSGMNYSDGVTPFVLAKIRQQGGNESYIWETGYRERQGLSPWYNRVMRFEPRPGYFQDDPDINRGRSPALSNDERTWPEFWPDKLGDASDPGWRGAWNGYFGKAAGADQESFSVMDDDFYDAWFFYPDSTDAFLTNPEFGKDDSLRRHGLGLRVEVRGFQWANPQAGNVIFWHYDIVNEGTTDYDDNIVFGLYMDSGVGGSGQGCDPLPESDDDNAFYDKSLGLNLVYTWDSNGHGVDLASSCSKTGYMGYAYLETPGNAFDGVDNDGDGITDELRDSTAVDSSAAILGADAIRAAAAARYDLFEFEDYYGPLEDRPAYRAGRWFLIDEDMDWVAELHDVGEDGVAGTGDIGEKDGAPTYGEPNVDKTDLNESDQIGLTSFKMNRIRAGQGNPDPVIDNIWFFEDENHWPQRMYEYFTNPNPEARFDSALAANYNIGFFFASGPFRLKAGKRERFSLALAYGGDLQELRNTVRTVQQIYNANYLFAVPPPMPTLKAETGDGYVRLAWDDVAERGVDPVTYEYDFEGYRIYRATDYEFRDAQDITTGTGSGPMPGNGRPIAQFDLTDGKLGFSRKTVEGVAYWLGVDSGLRHTWVDTTAVNGQEYFYAVTAYDYGFDPGVDSLAFYPSENAIAVSRTPRGGIILPRNVVQVRPNPRVQGWQRAAADTAVQAGGDGTGRVAVEVVASGEVPDAHGFRITFAAPHPDSIRAVSYALTDTTLEPDSVLFDTGTDLEGIGAGPVAFGLLPVIATGEVTEVDTAASRFVAGDCDARLATFYNNAFLSKNQRRLGYPDDLLITFSDTVQDTGLALGTIFEPTPAKFYVEALTPDGPVRLPFAFSDRNGDFQLNVAPAADGRRGEYIDVLCPTEASLDTQITWRVQLDTLGRGLPQRMPGEGDVYRVVLERPLGARDVFVFGTRGERVDPASAAAAFAEKPYVVPNPYVGSASFEPSRYAISGRGERRMEFRAVPQRGTVRIYTVRGELVRTLYQDGTTGAYVPWDLRTKDNLDVAPGLYIFHVESPGGATFVDKFAVLK